MKNRYIKIGLVFLNIIGLYSCSTYYYVPTSQNVLKFKEKGDANLSIGIDECHFTNYNIGYSITNNIALISDYKADNNSDHFLWDNELIIYKNYYNCFFPAINFGYGFGQIGRNQDYYKLNIYRQFIQPSLGYSDDYFDFALSARFTHVNYDLHNIKHHSIFVSNEEIYDFKDVGKKDFYFIEPSFTIGLGYKFIKLRFQHIAAKKLNPSDLLYIEKNMSLTLNLTLNINKIFTKNKKKHPSLKY